MNTRRALLFGAPLAVAAVGGVGFWVALRRMQSGRFDPRGVPSILTNKRVPGFRLPGLPGEGFSSVDLMSTGRPTLVNFWASWCPPCIQEHPVLMELQAAGVQIWGIAYKDNRSNSLDFLERNGNPFVRSAADAPGRVAIDWGLTGVPETFLVDGEGYVRWRMTGPLTREIVERQLKPQLAKYAA
jgi:cytochrome c biogenesis protein CcmG/thiol:disulfide interchange protein DsbE